ncbi:MAG: hypothetical protein ACYC7D_05315 [Nitrososphaerales archaeon]
MTGKTEKERSVLVKPSVHRELKLLSVASNVKIHDLANRLLEVMLRDKDKVRELILELDAD